MLKGLPDLKKNNIKTERPPDYFAEMLKSDDHMEKVSEYQLTNQRSHNIIKAIHCRTFVNTSYIMTSPGHFNIQIYVQSTFFTALVVTTHRCYVMNRVIL